MQYRLSKMTSIVSEAKPFWCVAKLDMPEPFREQTKSPDLLDTARWNICELQFVAQKGDRRLGRTPKIVLNLTRNNHFYSEPHRVIGSGVTVPKQISGITQSLTMHTTDFLGRLDQGFISQQAKELDHVEDI